jgi:hypothetical protein
MKREKGDEKGPFTYEASVIYNYDRNGFNCFGIFLLDYIFVDPVI